ncbi:MAG TPA: glyoxalase, partial [Gemmatimonadetes bacterium]|nr:glyoxalase [Gemmatimonadota bacterium]
MNEKSFGIQALGQVFVPVQELERAVAFYRDTLRIRFLFEAPPRMAFFDLDGIHLMLGEPE